MADMTCPKCGASAADVNSGPWEVIFRCNSGSLKGGSFMEHKDCMEARLRHAQARADKAEAEVNRLRAAVRVRDRLRWKFPAGIQKCSYCDMDTIACAHTCPTVTHPVEVPND